MKRKTIKKLGIIIMSAMIIASPVVTPFTTMTVYAEEESVYTEDEGTITAGESYDKNTANDVENYGTIKHNIGEVDCNWSKGTVENNEATGIIDGNYGKVENNLNGATINGNYGKVENNQSGGTIKFSSFLVSNNEGNIEENAGQVVDNKLGGQIDINNNIVQNNSGIITENYGSVWNNTGTIKNNYTSIDGYGGVVDENNGTIQKQWYEVNLENNTTELKIKGNVIKDIEDSGNTDVFVPKNASITIYSTNPNKIIDSVEDSLGGIGSFVKNADGSITISDILNPYSLLTTLVDKIFEQAPPSVFNSNDNEVKQDVTIEISFVAPDTMPVAPAIPAAQTKIVTPAGTIKVTATVAENPEAAILAAKTLQNNPAVVAQAQKLAVQIEAVTAAYKEFAVKELAVTPKQAVVGSAEYKAKQDAIVADLTNQVASLNKLTVQSLAAAQKVGVSVATGGCTKLDAANVSMLNEILTKGVPVTITYARKGTPVTIKLPAGVDLTRFIGADGRLDLTKLKAYIVK